MGPSLGPTSGEPSLKLGPTPALTAVRSLAALCSVAGPAGISMARGRPSRRKPPRPLPRQIAPPTVTIPKSSAIIMDPKAVTKPRLPPSFGHQASLLSGPMAVEALPRTRLKPLPVITPDSRFASQKLQVRPSTQSPLTPPPKPSPPRLRRQPPPNPAPHPCSPMVHPTESVAQRRPHPPPAERPRRRPRAPKRLSLAPLSGPTAAPPCKSSRRLLRGPPHKQRPQKT